MKKVLSKLVAIIAVLMLGATAVSTISCSGKSQEWYDKNQNFGDLEGVWVKEMDAGVMEVEIHENGSGRVEISGPNGPIIKDNVKFGRSGEDISILFSNLQSGSLHTRDGKLYTDDWTAFERK